MNKVIVSLFLLIVLSSQLFAQDMDVQTLPQNRIGLSVGLAAPSSPNGFTDNWNLGFNFGIDVEAPISPVFHFVGAVDYSICPMNYDHFIGTTSGSINKEGGAINLLNIMANIKAVVPMEDKSVAPYAIAGAGYFHLGASDLKISSGSSSVNVTFTGEDAFSAQFGAGLDIPFDDGSKVVFLEAKYVIGFTENESTSYIPVKLGIKFGLE